MRNLSWNIFRGVVTPRPFVWAQVGEMMTLSTCSRAGLLSVFTLSIRPLTERQLCKSVFGWPETGSKEVSARVRISHDRGINKKTNSLGLVQDVPMRKE